jgi:hypothetical protein
MFKFLLLLHLTALVACSPAEKPVETEHPVDERRGAEIRQSVEAVHYSLCTSLDTALTHPALVKTLIITDSITDGKAVAAQICALPNLTALWLAGQSRAELESLFDGISQVDSLQELEISQSRVELMGNLKKIKMMGNLKKIKNLKKIALKFNGMGVIPLDFLQAHRLSCLEIVEERFVLAGSVLPGNSLKRLAMSGYAKRLLPRSFRRLSQLQELVIDNSDVASLWPEIKGMKSLRRLLLRVTPLSHNAKALISLRAVLEKQQCEVKTEQDMQMPF